MFEAHTRAILNRSDIQKKKEIEECTQEREQVLSHTRVCFFLFVFEKREKRKRERA
jgi:hypothetical protein